VTRERLRRDVGQQRGRGNGDGNEQPIERTQTAQTCVSSGGGE
jgi:hypothetical protein